MKTKQSGQDGRKAKQKKQATPRARGYRKCPADDTVIVQITHEDGREWARVPFSRLEHSALKAVCDLRACTMQELFNEAVATELASRLSGLGNEFVGAAP